MTDPVFDPVIELPPTKTRRVLSKRGSKTKGARFERELAAYLALRLGLSTSRAPLSGGGAAIPLSGGADLIGTPGLHIEAKRCERILFVEWLRQAEKSVAKTGAPEFPVIINRQSLQQTGESLVCLRLDHFLALYGAWLRGEGYVR